MRKLTFWLVSVLAAASVFAADPVASVKWTVGGGNTLYNNGSNWSGGAVPWLGTNGFFSTADGSYTVTFPASGYTDMSATEVSSYGTVTFDTLGTWWLKPVAAIAWGNPTFRMGGGAHGFNIESTSTKAQMLLSNGVFKASVVASATTNILQSGFLNFYDPDGINSGNKIVLGHNNSRKDYVILEPGTTSRWCNIEFRAKGSENVFRVNGGYHEIFGTLDIANQTQAGTTGMVFLAGGELVNRSWFHVGCNKAQLGKVVVAPNGLWTATVEPQIGYGGNGVVEISGGTVVCSPGSLRIGHSSSCTGTLSITSGRLSSEAYETTVGNASGAVGYLAVSGGAVATKFFHVGASANATGTVEMTGGAWTNSGNGTVGNNGVGAMTVSSGSLAWNDWLMVGAASTASGRLTIAGGTTKFANVMPGFYGGDGTVDVTGGTNRFNLIQVGNAPCVRSLFRVSGGANDFGGMQVGISGKGDLEVSGGIVQTPNIYVGTGSNKTALVSSVLIAGGKIQVAGNLNVADNIDNSGLLILNGGSLDANEIRGWNGAKCRGGRGSASLEANGGLVRPRLASTTFLNSFDSAKLGAAGLTIESAGFDLTVPQAFSNQTSASGLLVKAGVGKLTLSGANGYDRTVVAGGALAVAANASLCGAVTVTNNAVLSLAGAASDVTLQSLTVGDAAKPGWLALDNSDLIHITQASGLTLPFAKLTLSSPSADGVYTNFICAGNVPSTVWQNCEVGNPVSGKIYSLSASYIAGSDTTALTLTIQDKATFAGTERVWDGDTDSLWNTTGNWTGDTVPLAGEAAVFPEAPMNKAVTTTAGATVGTLQFNAAAAYSVGGTEVLTLDNAGRFGEINGTAGAHAVTAPLALSRSMIVTEADGASVTLSGAVTGNGGIIKVGSGLLALNNANAFKGAVTVNGGTLSLGSSAAFGDASADRENLQLKSGTLRYAGDAASKARGFTISADASASAVVLDVQNDLTLVGQPWADSGALIKRGPGALRLSVSGSNNKLSVGNGMALNAALTFPASGDSPANGYGGFTVAEGTVRIEGAADAVTRIQNVAAIGANTASGTVSPALEISGGTVYIGGGNMHTYIGSYTPGGSVLSNAALRVTGGASVSADTLEFGNSASSPEFTVDNAAVDVGYMVVMNGITSSTVIRNGGRVSANYDYQFRAPFTALADNGLLEEKNTSRVLLFDTGSSGVMLVRNGGVLRVPKISMLSSLGVTLAFDSGVFQPTLSGMLIFRNDNKHTVDIRTGGATFEVGDGLTYAVARPLTGVGGLTKTGAGTLVLGATLQDNGVTTNATGLIAGDYAGPTRVAAGTLVVSNGTIRADAQVTVTNGTALNLSASTVSLGLLAGGGAVTNGTLAAARIAPGMTAGQIGSLTVDTLQFNGAAFACDVSQAADKSVTSNDTVTVTGTLGGAGFVDFGRTSANPLLVPFTLNLMAYNPANGTPVVSGWKVRNVGQNGAFGTFTAQNGVVRVTVRFGGSLVLVQ